MLENLGFLIKVFRFLKVFQV